MKVNFENCEVSLHELRKGVVVLCNERAFHIELLGDVWEYKGVGKVVDVYCKSFDLLTGVINNEYTNSYRLTWPNP